MDSIAVLIKELGQVTARTIVESHVVYPKTSNLQADKALYSGTYEDSLTSSIREIQESIELKAVDAIKDAVSLLILMEEFKSSVMLTNADMVVVYKGGFDIIQLVNKANPKSGRSIYVEINSCRNDLIRIVQSARGKEVPWLTIAIGAGVLVSVALQLMKR